VRGSNAEKAGLREGDVIKAASATVGSKLWTKTSVEGVQAATNSRLSVSDDISFRVERELANAGKA
jgi:hypothetical protein